MDVLLLSNQINKSVARRKIYETISAFKSDGSVDDAGIHRLVDFLIQHGLNGNNGFLVPISTTGNFLSLSLEERKHVADVFLKASEGLVPIVVGCNHIRLSEIIELAKFSQDCGENKNSKIAAKTNKK